MKKIYLILLFTVLCCEAFSQELLNKNKAEINTILAKQGGVLSRETGMKKGSMFFKIPYNLLMYSFTKPSQKINGVNGMQLLLNEGKCFQYTVFYSDLKYKKELIAKFSNSRLKHVDNQLLWQNKVEGYEMEINDINGIPMSSGNFIPVFNLNVRKTADKYNF
jgi:hypothetical protein